MTDEVEWKRLMDQATDAQRHGQFDTAERGFQSAMRIAEQLPHAAAYQGVTANSLAIFYQHQGDLDLAEKHFLIALSFLRQLEDRSMDRTLIANLANLYMDIGQISKAERLVRSCLPDEAHPSAAEREEPLMLSDLGSIRARQRRFADAQALFQQVLDLVDGRQDIGAQALRANALANLSELYYLTHQMPEAASAGRRALSIYETLPADESGGMIKALTNLAVITASTGATSESAGLFQRAIALSESTLGPDHPLRGAVLDRYAIFLRRNKDKGAARKAEDEARKIQATSRQKNQLGNTVEVSALQRR